MTTPRIRTLSARYSQITALLAAEPREANASGGPRLTLRAAGLVAQRADVAHELARAVGEALAAEPESAAPRCGSCGAEVTVDGCALCVARGAVR